MAVYMRKYTVQEDPLPLYHIALSNCEHLRAERRKRYSISIMEAWINRGKAQIINKVLDSISRFKLSFKNCPINILSFISSLTFLCISSKIFSSRSPTKPIFYYSIGYNKQIQNKQKPYQKPTKNLTPKPNQTKQMKVKMHILKNCLNF